MQLTSKILAVLVTLVYLTLAAVSFGWTPELGMFGATLLLPLLLIWFPDEIGDFRGHWRVQITSPTPGILVSLFGWFFLVGLPTIVALISLRRE